MPSHAQRPACHRRHFRSASRRGERAIQHPKSSSPGPAGGRRALGEPCHEWHVARRTAAFTRTSASSWFNTLALVILPRCKEHHWEHDDFAATLGMCVCVLGSSTQIEWLEARFSGSGRTISAMIFHKSFLFMINFEQVLHPHLTWNNQDSPRYFTLAGGETEVHSMHILVLLYHYYSYMRASHKWGYP